MVGRSLTCLFDRNGGLASRLQKGALAAMNDFCFSSCFVVLDC
jgi:hypothetical protein